jgi:outer membrane autotransporter protein
MVLTVFLGGDCARADTNSWISSTAGSWFTPANWSLAALPTLGDDALITNNTTVIIQGATAATASNVLVENGGVTVGNVSAGTLTVDNEISVGALGAPSTLTLNLGTISFNTLSVGLSGTYSDTTFGTLVLTGSDPTIQMAGSVNVVVNSQITGTSGLVKGGLGTLTLAGNNTYSGGTTIDTGTLRVGNGGTLGSLGSGDVTNNGALIFNRSNTIAVSNAISGVGTLTQAGAGTLTLLGTNTYSGTTFINAGTLQVGDGGTTGSLGTGAVSNNSVLVFNRSDSVIVSNAIAGAGALTQTGAGTLILAATNTYSGSTFISAGTLQVGDGGTTGSLGTGAVSNNSMLVFNRSDSLAVSNAISGTGSLTHAGADTLTLAGNNTYSGGTVIDAGTLQVGAGGASGSLGSGGVTNNGVLVFNRSDNIVVTNLIAGLGSLIQAGTNSLILSNVNTYSGGTFVNNGGTLAVRDSHALGSGDLNLISGTLRANAMVIELGGSYVQGSNGTLEIALGGTNVFGKLNIAGTATLDGTLHVVPTNNFAPTHNDSFVLLTASNGVTGTFSTFTNDITSPSVLLSPELLYNPNDVTLSFTQLSFVPFAATRNQRIVARNLNAVANSTNASAVALIQFLDFVNDPTNNLPLAFDLIAPEELGALFTVAFADMDAHGSRFLKRANELRAGYSGLYRDLYDRSFSDGGEAADNSTLSQPPQDLFEQTVNNSWAVYIEPVIQFADVRGDANASGYNQSGLGITVGLDRRVNEQMVFGGAASYIGNDVSLSHGGDISADSGFVQFYGVWFSRGLHLEGMLGAGVNSYDTSRQALQGKATGNADAFIWTGLLGGGYDWQNGPWSFGPQAVVQYECASVDAFTETGSMAPLRIDSHSEDALYTQLGMTVRYRGNIPGTWTFVTPEASLAWRHDYLDSSIPVTAQLASGDGNSFTVHGPELGTDSVVGSVGVNFQWVPSFSTYLYYVGQLGRTGYEAHNINAGARIGF